MYLHRMIMYLGGSLTFQSAVVADREIEAVLWRCLTLANVFFLYFLFFLNHLGDVRTLNIDSHHLPVLS